jgi:NAD(P)-dependent dehydrogenase (short-subunit alcohol dehydrogenase family)
MRKLLDSKVAVITGGGQGVGMGIAQESVAKEIEPQSGAPLSVATNTSKESSHSAA